MTAFQKNPRLELPKWRKVVNTLMPCVLRGTLPAVCAHVSWNLGGVPEMKGIAYKTSDHNIVPLAPELHVMQGNMPEHEFWVQNIRKAPRFFGQCVTIWRRHNRDPFIASDPEHVMPAIILWARNEFNIWQETGRPLWL
jgi:hypothetical protein